jgi:hypothetical protein
MQARRLDRFLGKVVGVGNAYAKYRAWAIICICFASVSFAGRAQTSVTAPQAEQEQGSLPSWLKSGTVRFARFDGGPMEARKAARSAWAAKFSPQDLEVLTDLYGTHGDRMIDLLVQAKVNFVWVTYSVGFSWKEEEAQRIAMREIVKKLHAHGIKAAAYVCAITVFWESMFKDDPQSLKWVMIGNDGVPYRYSNGLDAMRFVADVNNPGWVEYQKHRVGAIIDDGLDAIFFDNPNLDEHPNEESSVVHFFDQLLNYARREKNSKIPFFTNLGLQPPFNVLNRQMDFIFTEGWVEPGTWENQWEVSNIRRDRLVKGLNPGLKPIVSEYSHFHKGDRSDSYLGARSVKLAIAEGAAFGTSYTWDMEGPFDTALVANDPKALETWAAISQYNGFLAEHPELYTDAENVVPWVVLLPDSLDPDFDWPGSATRLDFLARHSVLGDFKFASRITKTELAAYQGAIIPSYESLSAQQQEMIREYQRGGGKVSVLAETSSRRGLNAEILAPSQSNGSQAKSAEIQAVAQIHSLAPDAMHIEVENSNNHVLANVTSAQNGGALVVHLLNYGQAPVGDLKVQLVLGGAFQKLAGHKPVLLSPDARSPVFRDVQWRGSTLEVTLATIDGYSIVVLQ